MMPVLMACFYHPKQPDLAHETVLLSLMEVELMLGAPPAAYQSQIPCQQLLLPGGCELRLASDTPLWAEGVGSAKEGRPSGNTGVVASSGSREKPGDGISSRKAGVGWHPPTASCCDPQSPAMRKAKRLSPTFSAGPFHLKRFCDPTLHPVKGQQAHPGAALLWRSNGRAAASLPPCPAPESPVPAAMRWRPLLDTAGTARGAAPPLGPQ